MPTLQGKYKVPHFDGKGEADNIFIEQKLPYTLLLTSAYWENLIYFGWGPTRGQDGKLALNFPMGDKKLPAIAVEDIGKSAFAIFKRGKEFIGKKIGIAGDLTGKEMAEALSMKLLVKKLFIILFRLMYIEVLDFRVQTQGLMRALIQSMNPASGVTSSCTAHQFVRDILPRLSRSSAPRLLQAGPLA